MKQLLFSALLILSLFTLCADVHAQSDILPAGAYIGRKSPVIQNELYIRLAPKAIDGRNFRAIANGINGIEIIEQLLPPERTLLYNSRLTTRNKKRKSNLQAIYSAEYSLVRSFKVRFSEKLTPEQMSTKLLMQYPDIEVAEPVYVHEVLTLPNDSRLDEAIQLPPMQAFEAWEVYKGDSTIVIGISDSGTEQTHEDLQASLWINEGEIPDNGIDDDNNGYVDDYNGYNFAWREDEVTPGNTSKVANTSVGNHGTGAAGLAGATPDNGVGILGSGFRSKLFPLKTVEFGGNFIRYGSNSIIYAGEMELDMLNCSWGSQNFSEIVRSATEYAIAKGVLITAGAGNNSLPVIFYPAAYKGVLGVGNTNTAGELARSNYGYSAKILASSEFAITTWSQNAYGGFCCTSGASALTSGIAALARGRFPQLSPEQIVAYLRQCTDDMSPFNVAVQDYLAGRANMLKVVSYNPDTIPGLVLDSFDILTPAGNAIQNRVLPGDTVRLRFSIKNVLASVGALQWQLQVLGNNPVPAISLLNTEAVTDTLPSGDTIQLTEFLVRIERFSETQVFFRLQASSANTGYKEFFLAPFVPTEEFITLENDSLVISIGDKAQIGYSGYFGARRGEGMYLKSAESKHSLLYEGGLFMLLKNKNGSTLVSSATRPESLDLPPVNDFSVLKRLAGNDLTSELESDNLTNAGLQLRIAVDALAANATAVSMPISVVRTNLTSTPPDTLSMGYFFDFEASADGNDRAMLYRPRFVDTTKIRAAFAMIRPASDTVSGSYCIVGVFSLLPTGAEPQLCIINNDNDVAGTPFGTYDGFSTEEKERSLSGGTSLLYDGEGDIGVVTGMRFPEYFTDAQPQNEVQMVLVLGAGHDSTAAAQALAQALAPYGIVSVQDAPITPVLWKVHPLPANNECRIYAPEHINGNVAITLFSVSGKSIKSNNITFTNGVSESIALGGIARGQYFIAVEQQGTRIVLPVIIGQ